MPKLVECWTGPSISVMLVKRFDIVISRGVILDQLFQQTSDKVGNRLFSLFFIVAVDVGYCNVVVAVDCLEVVHYD